MNFLENLIKIDVKKDMGIVGLTDEFFCVYLYDLFKQKNKNKVMAKETFVRTKPHVNKKIKVFFW